MAEAFAGSAVLEVDGQEVDITNLSVTINTGRKLVKTMNSQGIAKGYSRGIATYELSITVVVPKEGSSIDWENITDSKVTVYPLGQEDKRTSYLGCFTTQIVNKYAVEDEEMIDLQMNALRKVIE
ncbi:phage tail protein [Mergibacter septicus]|uniref:phage tail protein n=1 Tax=Mergibacter septicus TaxID=221402 RepID=UPI00117938AB|nr:phage tail protein [Mergibacter septicus]AWX14274.1 phage tail protein [Mergibacter septicus]